MRQPNTTPWPTDDLSSGDLSKGQPTLIYAPKSNIGGSDSKTKGLQLKNQRQNCDLNAIWIPKDCPISGSRLVLVDSQAELMAILDLQHSMII